MTAATPSRTRSIGDWLKETWEAFLPLATAVTGFVYYARHKFAPDERVEGMLIFIVSMLAIALSIERFMTLRKMLKGIDQAKGERATMIQDTHEVLNHVRSVDSLAGEARESLRLLLGDVKNVTRVQILEGKAIEAAAIAAIYECHDNAKIKATGQRHGKILPLYFTALAQHVRQASDRSGNMIYHAILSERATSDTVADDAGVLERWRAFRYAGCPRTSLDLWSVSHYWPFDVLICETSMIVALRGRDSSKFVFGMRLTGQDVVNQAGDWFYDELLHLATPIPEPPAERDEAAGVGQEVR